MIKYLGSKRTLLPVLTQLAETLLSPKLSESAGKSQVAATESSPSALDLFTGTTRVAQGFKRLGVNVTANDIASYSRILAETYIASDARQVDADQLAEVLTELENTPGREGYFTETFCRRARFFQPKNGERIDAIRERIENDYAGNDLYPILLTSLMEAADRVDSTTGQQMAYLKNWAARSYNDLELRVPELTAGVGRATQMDANVAARSLGHFDLVYLDPPYNQHRYFTNYHIWETLVRWDEPETYGVAQKRTDAREPETKSAYNRKREMPVALADAISYLDCSALILSYNNESWVSFEELYAEVAKGFADTVALAFPYKRYVGAQIGVYNPAGERVGKVGPESNLEYLFIGANPAAIARVRALVAGKHLSLPGQIVQPR